MSHASCVRLGRTGVCREAGGGVLPLDGNGSFRPWVVLAWVDSALGRFGPVWWVVSAYFFSTIRLVTEGQLNTFLASWRVHGSW